MELLSNDVYSSLVSRSFILFFIFFYISRFSGSIDYVKNGHQCP